MKQPENTIAVKVAEYRLHITRLRICRDSLAGCCSDAERRGWRLRALEQLSKASLLYWRWASSADTCKFQQACEGLQQHISRVYQKASGAVICLHPLPRQNFKVSV